MLDTTRSTPGVESRPNEVGSAVIVLVPGSSGLRIAALTVLDRLLVAVHRAGVRDIVVAGAGPLPPVPRAEALGVRFDRAAAAPGLVGPTLLLRAEVLVQVADVRRVMAGRGRLVAGAAGGGEGLPVGVVSGEVRDWDEALERAGAVAAEGVACWVRTEDEAVAATRALWASLTSASDGHVDRVFNRPLGRPLARWLSRTWVTPNQISVVSILIGVMSGVMFGVGRLDWSVAAALLFQLSAVVDCVDGDVARVVFKESPLGKWLDIVGDQVVHVTVFAGIAVGLWRAGSTAPVGWLGLFAVVGALMSFLMVLRGMRREKRTGDGRVVGRFLDAATNRDFSVLVLVLACVGRLDVFLWLAAVGSHVFWVALAWLDGRGRVEVKARGVS